MTLRPVEGACLPFLPGQFTMLYAPGVGEIPISISGRARSGGYVQTIRAVGAVSGALCRMRPGDVVGVRGPYGTAWDVPAAAGLDVVVVAGGLGLAPLRPVIREYRFLALRHPAEYAILSGSIAASDGSEFAAADWPVHVVEEQVPHSTALHARLDGSTGYLVGARPATP
ncbi:hypothetical protein ACSDR0_46610 [Streptosporangium sp. G11]|uniref:hypothetical protein n=1 Tax=Streptosporangium sp. G11 TaxID=3436926 RepID=UPI003EBD3526